MEAHLTKSVSTSLSENDLAFSSVGNDVNIRQAFVSWSCFKFIRFYNMLNKGKRILASTIIFGVVNIVTFAISASPSKIKGVIAQTGTSSSTTTKLAIDTYDSVDGSKATKSNGSVNGGVKYLKGREWEVFVTNPSIKRVLGYFDTYEFNREGREVKKSSWTRYLGPKETYSKKIFVSPSTVNLSLAVNSVENVK